MSRARELGLLARQLTAHRAYVLRRAAREAGAALLAEAGRGLPGAAGLAAKLHPGSARAQAVLATRADRAGDTTAAARYRSEAERLTRNTAETSVLTTLRNTLAWRNVRRSRGGADDAVTRHLAEGRLDEAERALEKADGSVGSQLDGWMQLAAAARAAGRDEAEAEFLNRVRHADPGRPDVWRALGERALAAGRLDEARTTLEHARSLDPMDPGTWLALGDALAGSDPAGARDAWWEALQRAPERDDALRRIEATERDDSTAWAATGSLRLDGVPAQPLALRVGVARELRIELTLEPSSGEAALYLLEPFGGGLLCEPGPRVPVPAGGGRVSVRLEARRPDLANAGQPWPLSLALVTERAIHRAEIRVTVPDDLPGRVYEIVTEDHELYDERESFDTHVAHTTLVSKSRLAEQIANHENARWTHVVDVASLAAVEWAADQSDGDTWRTVAEDCREHLSEAVANGNDLALHFHAFHDPAAPGFCHGFDRASDRVTTDLDFLETPLPRRGFWSRAFPTLGEIDDPESRAGATWRGIGRLEALGRLGDPRYRVTFFRAGSFDFGEDAAERARSVALLARLGVLADSDVPKPRLYHRPMTRSAYPIDSDLRAPATSAATTRMLELRPEFNVEADFLSDVHVLNRYVDGRVEGAAGEAQEARPGVHVICAMTHDKFINWRMGRTWDSLDPDYGDWRTIRDHLRYVGDRHPEVRRSTAREAVLEWYERYTPAPIAWREEEIVVLSGPDDASETFRYAIRLLGRDLPLDRSRGTRVAVHLPAWLHGRIQQAWIERDGERIESHALACGPPRLEYRVHNRGERHELVVEAMAGDGIRAVRRGSQLELSARHRYRRASLEIPAGLTPDGNTRRLRDVALAPAGDGFGCRIDLATEGQDV